MMSQPTRLIIIHEHQVFYECLTSALTKQENFTVIGLAHDPGETLNKVKAHQPDIVLIDINLPDNSAIKLTRQISLELPHTKVIILGLSEADTTVVKCVEAGARGCVLKESSLHDLYEIICAVRRGETFCSPRIAYSTFSRVAELARRQRDRRIFESVVLTTRELEILHLIADGLSNKQIAERLHLSLHTVKNHVHNILEKLQVNHRSEAVHYAKHKGLLGRIAQSWTGLEK